MHQLRRDEVVGPELPRDDIVHDRVLLGRADEDAPGMTVGAGHGRHHGGVQAVAHRVDHGRVQDVVVEGVVEAVAGGAVGGFQDAGHLDLRHGHRRRRQQAPRLHWISADMLIGSRRRAWKNWSV